MTGAYDTFWRHWPTRFAVPNGCKDNLRIVVVESSRPRAVWRRPGPSRDVDVTSRQGKQRGDKTSTTAAAAGRGNGAAIRRTRVACRRAEQHAKAELHSPLALCVSERTLRLLVGKQNKRHKQHKSDSSVRSSCSLSLSVCLSPSGRSSRSHARQHARTDKRTGRSESE